MVSLISEITDSKGRRARCGWVFYDAGCPFCTRMARRLERVLEPRGYGFAPLQDSRVAALLGLPPGELLREMHVLTADGRQFGGADGFVYLARQVWWAWPVYALAQLPGGLRLFRAGYRWIAARRRCASGNCAVEEDQ